jgi:hypothetical protein
MLKKSLVSISLFYDTAKGYHLMNPEFYYPLIPDYQTQHKFINIRNGSEEILPTDPAYYTSNFNL